MPDEEKCVEYSIHEDLKLFAQSIYDKYKLSILNIHFDWACALGGGATVIKVETEIESN